MKDLTLKAAHSCELTRGRIKSMGLIEKCLLMITGYIDGGRGLPRETPSGWTSPHIDKELNSYAEFTSRVWGRLQIEEEDNYAHLRDLIDSITKTAKLIEEAENYLAEASCREKSEDSCRGHGEDRLTEGQVASRRTHERAKKLAPITSRITDLRSKFAAEIEELSAIRSNLTESSNSARMICNRVRDHLGQRIDVYWNFSLRRHPKASEMPAVPTVDIISNAESMYTEIHKELLQKAELLIQALLNDEKEAA